MFDKPTVAQVREHVLEYLNGRMETSKYHQTLFAVEREQGFFIPCLLKEKELYQLAPDKAISIIRSCGLRLIEILADTYRNTTPFNFSKSKAKDIFETFLIDERSHFKHKVKQFAFKSEDVYTFHRISFDPVDGDTPTWDRLLSNFTNVDAIKSFIGSLFFDNSDRSQYLWLYGKGGNGKSTMARILGDVLGKFVRFEQPPRDVDKYWTYGLLNTRLCVLDDCNKYGFVTTGLFKSITGGVDIPVEQKFMPSVNAKLNVKFLFTSNEMPAVSSDISDQRRIILSTALNDTQFAFDAEFMNMLKKEVPHFIHKCIASYSATCLDGRPIPCDNIEAMELGDVFNEEFEAFINQYFEVDPNGYCKISEFVVTVLRFGHGINKRRLNRFLENQGMKRQSIRINGEVCKVWSGIKPKVFCI